MSRVNVINVIGAGEYIMCRLTSNSIAITGVKFWDAFYMNRPPLAIIITFC